MRPLVQKSKADNNIKKQNNNTCWMEGLYRFCSLAPRAETIQRCHKSICRQTNLHRERVFRNFPTLNCVEWAKGVNVSRWSPAFGSLNRNVQNGVSFQRLTKILPWHNLWLVRFSKRMAQLYKCPKKLVYSALSMFDINNLSFILCY